ncbi:hypothetical protein VNI00_018315 [Paramarasmius palmivorus]|uniref:Uncharacterized protein n=1 Tax=Paramarasmius palmivorus TaxID=297713 RepID=A0AAW0B0E9_9AGAR
MASADSQPGSSNAKKRKRGAGTPPPTGGDDSPQASTSKRMQAPPPKAKKRRTRRNRYKVSRKNVPESELGTKATVEIIVRALWTSYGQDEIPPKPTPEMFAAFEQTFQSDASEDLFVGVGTSFTAFAQSIRTHIANARKESATSPSRILKNIAKIEDTSIEAILGSIGSFGLQSFCPDVLGDAYSPYNIAHRSVALSAIRAVIIAKGCRHLGPNPTHANDNATLVKYYDNFIFCHMHKNVVQDEKEKDSVRKAITLKDVYRHRSSLRETRDKYLREHSFHQRTRRLLLEPACCSDDEPTELPDKTVVYKVKKVAGRSENVTNFFKWIDEQIKEEKKGLRVGRNIQNRNRQRDAEPAESAIPGYPKDVSLDWFDPGAFNKMTPLLRFGYQKNAYNFGAAIPSDFDELVKNQEKFRKMKKKDWDAGYGKPILQAYKFPTKEELNKMMIADPGYASSDEDESDMEMGEVREDGEDGAQSEREEYLETLEKLTQIQKGKGKKKAT